MDKFLEMKERGETILFSELLAEIPSDDVLRVLFPPQKRAWKQLATKRGMEVLKLHLNGFRQPEIAEKLDLTPSQVAYASAMIKNSLYKRIPPYIDVDIPSLRKILGLEPKKRVGYTKLSELLQDIPSDEELQALFVERGNIVRPGGKPPPTSKDLQLLEMRSKGQCYDSIGEEIGGAQVVHVIVQARVVAVTLGPPGPLLRAGDAAVVAGVCAYSSTQPWG